MVFQVFNQEIKGVSNDISLFVKREDLIHPIISGNKYRKLKYNLLQARKEKAPTLLTFGGAFSNHIAAVAFAGKEHGFNTIGVIRGEELHTKIDDNPTLFFAKQNGMKFYFDSRENFRNKDSQEYQENLKMLFGDFYLIPEGGTNELAVQGCMEILTAEDNVFDYICCSVGTGGTISGILNSVSENQKVIGFSALKGEFLNNVIRKFTNAKNWSITDNYTFGGYAKTSKELIDFINSFYKRTSIPLDPIYTGKMLFGIEDLIEKEYFPKGSKILAIHTGGLQGVLGMNRELESKKLQKIIFNV